MIRLKPKKKHAWFFGINADISLLWKSSRKADKLLIYKRYRKRRKTFSCYLLKYMLQSKKKVDARVVWDHEAAGSIPVTSTNLFISIVFRFAGIARAWFFCN